MAKVELALWRNWPPLFDVETQQWRTRAVRWVEAVVAARTDDGATSYSVKFEPGGTISPVKK